MRFSSLPMISVLCVVWAVAARAEVAPAPLTTVPLEVALRDARALAGRHTGMEVLRIEGKSMLPFFGEGSVVVVKKIDGARLRAGMVVVYSNRFGETVAHRLVETTAGGWIAKGFNNAAADSTVVNASNLIGVVYATFHSSGQVRTAGFEGLAAHTPVALAAPAR